MDFPQIAPEQLRVMQVFHPLATQRMLGARKADQAFVHYASADALVSMIDKNEVWMRKAATMNDFREIEYGRDCLVAAYKSNAGEKFKALIEEMFPGLVAEFETYFDGWYPHLWSNTFLTCLSEHDSSEDGVGRLSMWRAYGGKNSVGVVVNGAMLLSVSDALAAYSSPVEYLSIESFATEFSRVVQAIDQNADFVKALGKDAVFNILFNVFRMACIGTKHPGFKEEREWRIFYSPKIKKSTRIIEAVESINGVPQVVQKIPLVDVPQEGLIGISIEKFVKSVIIGPSQFPFEIREAIIKKLADAKVTDAERRVVVSNIPLRNWGG